MKGRADTIKYLVWDEDSDEEDQGRAEYEASTPVEAAEQWVLWSGDADIEDCDSYDLIVEDPAAGKRWRVTMTAEVQVEWHADEADEIDANGEPVRDDEDEDDEDEDDEP